MTTRQPKLYTMYESRMILGIDHKTLLDWCKKADITPIAQPTDKRVRCLTTTHIAQLAHDHRRQLSPAAIQRSPILKTIVQRIEQHEEQNDAYLEALAIQQARIDALEQWKRDIEEGRILLFRPRSSSSNADPLVPRTHGAALGTPGELPSKSAASRIVQEHLPNVTMETIRKWPCWAYADNLHDRASVVRAVRELISQEFYMQYQAQWQPCQKDDCPCR